MYRRILVPTDGSDIAQKAVRHAIAIAKLTGGELLSLYVIPNPSPGDIWDIWTPEENEKAKLFRKKFEENLRCMADRYLSEIKRASDKQGLRCECISVMADSPAEEIIRTAEEKGCDLIVMSSHGKGGIGAVLGSVTLKVLSKTKVPVLVCR